MNILILTNHLNIGGITSYVFNLSRGLVKKRHRVFVGSCGGQYQKTLEQNGIYTKTLPLKTKSILSPRIFLSYFILRRYILKNHIQIIHSQTRITQFLAFLLSKRLKIPYVSTFHGFYQPHFFRKKIPCFGNKTIAISKAVAEHLINDLNLDTENVRVIYNALETDVNAQIHQDYRFLKGAPTLGIVARLSEEKGHFYLFAAFAKLLADYPLARLLVVGKGKKENELKDWVRKYNLKDRIIFLGELPNLGSLFNVLDICILPSLLEGLGLSILEAQAWEVPMIATRVGGITEIIQDRETGILVEPADSDGLYRAIKLLLEDTPLRRQIIDNAKKQIKERFSLEKMVGEVELVYEELLRKRDEKI